MDVWTKFPSSHYAKQYDYGLIDLFLSSYLCVSMSVCVGRSSEVSCSAGRSYSEAGRAGEEDRTSRG